MTWNYRVMRHDHGEHSYLAIHEVYYTDDKPDGWTEVPVMLTGKNRDEMRFALEKITKALEKPILEYTE